MKSNNVLSLEDAKKIVAWYKKHKRSFPWRKNQDPYRIWVSEIMLQQTRIEAVLPRYELFLKQCPTIDSLAHLPQDKLLKLWEGMGYYSRVKNMQKTAKILVKDYKGIFPKDMKELQSLPGIGPYTAGAISSMAYDLPFPCVDGNVLRVLSRYWMSKKDVKDPSTQKQVAQILQNVLEQSSRSPHFSSNFNQGLMEIGETICLPNGTALCKKCPLASSCKARKHNQVDAFPIRSSLPKRKIEHRTVFIIRNKDSFLLHRRPNTGLLSSLHEFPNVLGTYTPTQVKKAVEKMGYTVLAIKPLPSSKHLFSHIEWRMKAYEICISPVKSPKDIFMKKKERHRYIIPSAFNAYLEYYDLG